MSELKRKITETDPDYEDAADQQAKRQRVLEQDARETACKKITSIIKKEFQKEISDKERELLQIDLRLNQARLIMDRLRACVVASYYGRANRTLSTPAPSNSSSKVPPPSIHPTVKKFIGKAPKNLLDQPSSSSTSIGSQETTSHINDGEMTKASEETTCIRATPLTEHSSSVPSPTPRSLTSTKISKPLVPAKGSSTYEDRRSRFKIKKKIVIGNVSRYIPVDQRESTDMSSHKWMVYVRGHKSDPDISGFVKKVWFFLHHSYKPNDHVEISCPPFHLTRRGWGEFPVRVQLHFVDPRNKKVDIIHHLKLDKTFTGLQKLGAETVVEVELERDFFDNDDQEDDKPQQSSVNNRTPHFSHKSSLSSSLPAGSPRMGSSLHQAVLSSKMESSSSVSSSPVSVTENSAFDSSLSSKGGQKKSSSSKLISETRAVSTSNLEEEKIKVDDCENPEVLVVGHEGQRLRDESRNKNVLCRDKSLDCDGVKLDTNWIKVETEEVENGSGEDLGCGESKTVGYIERREDASTVGLGNDEFNVTIKHEEVQEHGEEEMDFQISDNFNVEVENICPDQGVMCGMLDVLGAPEAIVEEELVSEVETLTSLGGMGNEDTKPNIEQAVVPGVKLSPKVLMASSACDNSSQMYLTMSDSSFDQNQIVRQPGGSSSVSLLNLSTLEKMKQQQELIKKQQQQTVKPISLLKPQTVKQNISSLLKPQAMKQNTSSLLKPQSILNQSQISSAEGQKFTVINFAKHQKNVTSLPPPPTSLHVTKSAAVGGLVVTSSKTLENVRLVGQSNPTLTPQSVKASNLNKTIPKLLQVVNQPHKISSVNNIVTQQQNLQSQVKKVSLLSPGPNLGAGSGKKIIVLKPTNPSSLLSSPSSLLSSPSSLLSPAMTSELVSPSQNTDVPISILPPSTPKSKKQISLLTGLVVNAAKNPQPQNQPTDIETTQTQNCPPHQPTSNQNVSVQPTHDEGIRIGGNFVRIAKPSNQHIPVNVVTDNGHVIISKTSPHTAINQVLPPPIVSSSNYSLLNPSSQSIQIIGNKSIASNSILAQTSTPNIVIAYPNTHNIKNEPTSTPLNFVTSNASEYVDVKMSAIGKTKYRMGQQTVVHQDPEQERIWRQYQVLNNYKKSINECHREQQSVRMYHDIIEGEADVVPKLNPDEYPDMISLTKAAIRLHPIVQTSVNKLTHPYCAESRDQWFSWPVGKQRASEWHRACFTLKYIKDCIQGDTSFKGEKLMTTNQLVRWCRLHAYSPQTPIYPEPSHVVKEEQTSSTVFISNPCVSEMPLSFTSASDVKSQLSCLSQAASSSTDAQEVEIVLEEFFPGKVEVKEETMDTEDESQSELLPLSDGAVFVHDWMRKRGVKLLTQDNVEEKVSADVLYQVMMEFGSDILRKAFSVYSQREKPSDNLSVQDIHSALCSLPVAAFCRNAYLGKEEEEEESGGSSASR